MTLNRAAFFAAVRSSLFGGPPAFRQRPTQHKCNQCRAAGSCLISPDAERQMCRSFNGSFVGKPSLKQQQSDI